MVIFFRIILQLFGGRHRRAGKLRHCGSKLIFNLINFFLFAVPPVCSVDIYNLFSLFILSSFFLFLSLPFRQRFLPWKCDNSYSLLCCIAFARGHRKTAENGKLVPIHRPFNRIYPQSTVSEKMTFHWAFRYTKHRTLSVF